MSERLGPNAPDAIWQWPATPVSVRNLAAARRRRAALQGVAMATVAAALSFVLRRPGLAGVVSVVAALLVASGFFAPPFYDFIARAARRLGLGAAVVLSWLLLFPVYALFFVPMGLFLRLRGRDPLQRRWEHDRPSYWETRKPASDPRAYTRQF